MPTPEPVYEESKIIEQSDIIPMINNILKRKGIDLQADVDGICNGLAAVYIKYALQGKASKFAEMLEVIQRKGKDASIELGVFAASGRMYSLNPNSSEFDSDVSKFIQEVLLAFLPGEFDNSLGQADGLHALTVPVKKTVKDDSDEMVREVEIPQQMQRLYKLGLVADINAWKQIFNDMRAPGTAWHVGSLNHAIAVFVNKDGNFEVYDPNYPKISVFKDGEPDPASTAGEQLELFLRTQYQLNNGTRMALTIDVVAHPESKINFQFPDKESIIRDVDKEGSNMKNAHLSSNGPITVYNQLVMAAKLNDTEMLKLWLERGAEGSQVALTFAAMESRLDAIDVLLDQKYRNCLNDKNGDPTPAYLNGISEALKAGRSAVLEKLLNNPDVSSKIVAFLQNGNDGKKYQAQFLESAASLKSPDCIRILVGYLEKNIPGLDMADMIRSNDAVQLAEKSGDAQCLQLLKNLSSAEPAQAHNNDHESTFANIKLPPHPSNKQGFAEFISDLASGWKEALREIKETINSRFRAAPDFKSRLSALKGESGNTKTATSAQNFKNRLLGEKQQNKVEVEAEPAYTNSSNTPR
ncbi:hypothetical protein ACFORL_12200 [Legionella dresdenensis]|uniref:Ankyrin repeat-containing protein n=1 Tax=Legionella dresdenensis TaxID=450200 RepID=A0ABV8CIN0_9GAMM